MNSLFLLFSRENFSFKLFFRGCACGLEREREREGKIKRGGVCVSVSVCVCEGVEEGENLTKLEVKNATYSKPNG